MNNFEYIDQLRSALNQLKDDDLVPAFFLMAIDIELNSFRDFQHELDVRLMSNFIQRLNTIKDLNEIPKMILDYYSTQGWGYIRDYINEVDRLKYRLNNRGRDISKYQSDQRLLAFALHCYSVNSIQWERCINDIKNHYFRFLFVIHCHPQYSQHSRKLDDIEKKYSYIINKNLIHFLKNDTSDFYRWAKKYMDGHEKYNSTIYTPITDDEYRMTVNIIFDRLFDENEDIYSALKEKISNAWYQKIYRQKNKGKKAHHYALPKRALEALGVLAFKWNVTEERVIEKLINERYIKECADSSSGNSLY